MPMGPYDIALAKEELTAMAAAEDEMRKNKEIMIDKKNNWYKKQKEMSDQLVEKMTTLQQKHIDQELEKWERGEWNPRDHRASMDEVTRKIKERYQFNGEDLL
jgi:Ni/Co efflux regulator RcnB